MLAIINIENRCCYAEVTDGSYDTISKLFETIGCPELVTKEIINKSTLEVGKRTDLYDWDILAPFIQSDMKMISEIFESEDIEPIGSLQIMDSIYVWTDQY